MRADRLLSVLLLLQTRGQVSAQTLADELGVSLRTVYRDIDALSGAGVPIYAERGASGGYRLIDGYRTRLTGLTTSEAESLFLAGLPGPAADLGLDASLALAELKLLAALPPELQSRAERIRQRFHLDAPTWFHRDGGLPSLSRIAEAVWNQQRLDLAYQRPRKFVERIADPLGLVLKAGVWYLVANVEDQTRVYRISRIVAVTALGETFTRPADFDLAAFWQTWSDRFEQSVYRGSATLRVTQSALDWLPYIYGSTINRAATDTLRPSDRDGWFDVTLPYESLDHAAADFLRLGTDAEIMDPPELRARVARIVTTLAATYGSPPTEITSSPALALPADATLEVDDG